MDQDITIIFITHDLDEAVYLADRILVLKPHPGEVLDAIVKNNYKYQQNLRKKAQNWLEWLKKEAVSTGITDQAFEALKTIIFTRLEGIVQSSAAVEMVNSILRPYLNQSRDQISQPYLNLIMDYYNHRPFERGKRKGKAPIEILTGKKQNGDWFDKIIESQRLKKE